MRKSFVYTVLITALAWSNLVRAEELIYLKDWARINGATSALQLPALQRVVAQFAQSENAKIMIHYPGGDQGNQRAIELRDWLVSLGIELSAVELQPGSGNPQAIMVKTKTDGLP